MPAKVIKLVGLTHPPFSSMDLSPTNLITFASTQNGEYNKLSKVGLIPINLVTFTGSQIKILNFLGLPQIRAAKFIVWAAELLVLGSNFVIFLGS